jgi:RHS repeat-associated protein
VVENGVRKTYSARYYNPATGRFLSRDPNEGKPIDPKTLHKYLYAGGDPINSIDPRGRGIIEWLGAIGVSVEMTEAWVESYMVWCSEMMTTMLYPGAMAADFEPADIQELAKIMIAFCGGAL